MNKRLTTTGGSTLATREPAAASLAASQRMRRIARAATAPEMKVRRFLHARGLRYSTNTPHLPGRPDLCLTACGSVVFVHGCFWHGHDCPHGRVQAKTNLAFWTSKIAANRERDERKHRELVALGWRVEVLWECQCDDARRLAALARRMAARRGSG
jgi:DNA mismatch endonuclease, patch repair protein